MFIICFFTTSFSHVWQQCPLPKEQMPVVSQYVWNNLEIINQPFVIFRSRYDFISLGFVCVMKVRWYGKESTYHYRDVIMSTLVSQITSASIVYSRVCSGAAQRKHRSSASLAFVRGIHRWLVNSSHKGPVTRKYFLLMTSSCETWFHC